MVTFNTFTILNIQAYGFAQTAMFSVLEFTPIDVLSWCWIYILSTHETAWPVGSPTLLCHIICVSFSLVATVIARLTIHTYMYTTDSGHLREAGNMSHYSNMSLKCKIQSESFKYGLQHDTYVKCGEYPVLSLSRTQNHRHQCRLTNESKHVRTQVSASSQSISDDPEIQPSREGLNIKNLLLPLLLLLLHYWVTLGWAKEKEPLGIIWMFLQTGCPCFTINTIKALRRNQSN